MGVKICVRGGGGERGRRHLSTLAPICDEALRPLLLHNAPPAPRTRREVRQERHEHGSEGAPRPQHVHHACLPPGDYCSTPPTHTPQPEDIALRNPLRRRGKQKVHGRKLFADALGRPRVEQRTRGGRGLCVCERVSCVCADAVRVRFSVCVCVRVCVRIRCACAYMPGGELRRNRGDPYWPAAQRRRWQCSRSPGESARRA